MKLLPFWYWCFACLIQHENSMKIQKCIIHVPGVQCSMPLNLMVAIVFILEKECHASWTESFSEIITDEIIFYDLRLSPIVPYFIGALAVYVCVNTLLKSASLGHNRNSILGRISFDTFDWPPPPPTNRYDIKLTPFNYPIFFLLIFLNYRCNIHFLCTISVLCEFVALLFHLFIYCLIVCMRFSLSL